MGCPMGCRHFGVRQMSGFSLSGLWSPTGRWLLGVSMLVSRSGENLRRSAGRAGDKWPQGETRLTITAWAGWASRCWTICEHYDTF